MFKVSARTILELGSELISSDIIAFYELIKNGFDAGTTNGVEIHFNVLLRRNNYLTLQKAILIGKTDLVSLQKKAEEFFTSNAPVDLHNKAKALLNDATDIPAFSQALDAVYKLSNIVISDSGSGMSIEDLNKNFMVIGTPSRKHVVDAALKSGSDKTPYLGEKGIGRLSAMRLGNRLAVITARTDDKLLNCLEVDWSAFAKLDAMIEDIKVAPVIERSEEWQYAKIQPGAFVRCKNILMKQVLWPKSDGDYEKGPHPDDLINELRISAKRRHQQHVAHIHRNYGREIGLVSKRGTVKLRYAPTDDFLKALLFANVEKRIELHQFLALLWQKYALVFGDKEAEKILPKDEFDKKAFQANARRLEQRLASLGLLKRLSDGCAYVLNPYARRDA